MKTPLTQNRQVLHYASYLTHQLNKENDRRPDFNTYDFWLIRVLPAHVTGTRPQGSERQLKTEFPSDEWRWLPARPAEALWGETTSWTAPPPRGGGAAGRFWERPWRLRAAVVRRWRAHREGLQGLWLHQNEQLAVTWGRGHPEHKDASVLRCWRIANASPGNKHDVDAAFPKVFTESQPDS